MCLLAPLGAQETRRTFPVPGHGALQLSVPKDWRVHSQTMKDPAALMLRFRPGTGEAFYVQVTALWLDAAKLAKKTPEQLRADVASSAKEPLRQAVEKEARIDELRGAKVLGYHYSLTDRAPKPGEFKYMTQGIFLAGELLTVFTILYQDPAGADRGKVLDMFAGASYGNAPHAGFSFDLGKPPIRVSVPNIPPMEMGPHPLAGSQPHALYMGSGPDGYTISVLMPTADKGMTPRDCARSSYRSLASRYGLDPKHVVSHQPDDSTFVMLFPFKAGPVLQFKAYLLSAYGGTHCMEVHISKTLAGASQEALAAALTDWFQDFREAKIEVY